uniref:DNA-directed RNA polymerase subunit beta n=1 Tax=Dictyopteris divaricata TaxID=156996 RepID=A0A2I4Q2B1_9PHAE|nr:DNA-directed RNA polymerase beta chain [Dictyopteris divaricata]YP_010205269.1 DNA-directed RNA polymerase beta chain [Grateloupia livida]AQZ24978.1 DNA-directed RNA polymerase beta chain [Dictyopteris divaricata]UAV85838.1 DNA-directed RNA polymerase beta chain [Grateloupia livida]
MRSLRQSLEQKLTINLPDLSEIQRLSFCWFLTEGLPQELANFPLILNKKSGIQLVLYGHEYKIYYPKFSVLNALKKGSDYNLKIYVLMNLALPKGNKDIFLPIQIEDSGFKEYVFLGEVPLMTPKGTFIFNGCERIIVSQIVRSPGVYYKYLQKDKKSFYEATIISNYGSWLSFELEYNLIWVKIDKQYKIPINWFLVSLGLTENEIFESLRNYDFLQKSIKSLNGIIYQKMFKENEFGNYNASLLASVFRIKELITTRLFNNSSYDLGEIGRKKLNKRLGINLPLNVKFLTSLDILKTIDNLIDVSFYNEKLDEIDSLENRRVRSIGELIQSQVRIALTRLGKNFSRNEKLASEIFGLKKVKKRSSKKSKNIQTQKSKYNIKDSVGFQDILTPSALVSSKILTSLIREFFGLSPLSQYFDEINPLAQLTHKRRISSLGPGGLNSDHVSFTARDIHPTQYGRLCPIETPEGQRAGLITSLATHAKIDQYGFIKTPFFKVYKGQVLKNGVPIYLTAEKEALYKVAAADIALTPDNFFKEHIIPVRFNNEFILTDSFNVNFVAISPIQILAAGASLIPFLEHNDANRALMGSNMQRQALPLLQAQKPIVGTGIECQIALDSLVSVLNLEEGVVESVSADRIIVLTNNKNKPTKVYFLDKFRRSNQETIINQQPIVWPGQLVKAGQIIADGPATEEGELALGQNLRVAYLPWEGYNYEDAIIVSERLIHDDLFSSLHIEKYELYLMENNQGLEELTRDIPRVDEEILSKLDKNGLVKKGTFVRGGDILVGKITPIIASEELPESKLLRAVFEIESPEPDDTSLKVPNEVSGRVIDISIASRENGDTLETGVYQIFRISIAQIKKIKIGDKISGRHGNKGVISKIVPIEDLPFLPDGNTIDVLLNPLGVPSRMNVGQIFECLLGFAGDYLNQRYKVLPFDEMYCSEASRILVNKTLCKASKSTKNCWLFNPSSPGKILLTDGRTGENFDNPILVGKPYLLKLMHLVDKKMHARSTGPYSLVTQQPLKGKSNNGGQRFGEMEVWALQAYGVAYTLQELLTLKSDDMKGRNEVYKAIVKGHPIPKPRIPESFRVLLRELNSLGLDLTAYQLEKLNNSELGNVDINLMSLL